MISSFQGEYRFLSNFYPAEVRVEGITYPTSEHAYQAAKSTSTQEKAEIARLPTPGDAKRYGLSIRLRPDWGRVKKDIMLVIVLAKFRQNPDLADKLLATGDEKLIEGNSWGDTYWGICGGKGQNHLGRILMLVRTKIKKRKARK